MSVPECLIFSDGLCVLCSVIQFIGASGKATEGR